MKRQTFILVFREDPRTVDALLRAAENDLTSRRATAYQFTSEYGWGGSKREVSESDRRTSQAILDHVVPLSGFLARLQRQVRVQYKPKVEP